jgi:adenine-specific DNA-methyltransferase
MSIEKLQLPLRLDQERIEAIKTLLPEAVADGRISFDTLRDLLANVIEDDDQSAEHFGLTWPGKREARRLAMLPSKGTLAPVPGEGVDEENTENIFIEGENLESLKILKKSYAGKIKLIYIDPPYNTGQDFIYKDDYSEPLESFLRRTGQADEEGKLLVSSSKADGRFHSNWLSMIYPRLKLARELLREDGVIFVSIDDNEVHNLRQVMSEIFGEENFLACVAWEKRYTRSNNAKLFYSLKDSILVYRKTDAITYLREGRTDKANSIYSNPDDDPRGDWTSSSYVNPATKEQRPNLVYTITNPFTKDPVDHPTHAWKYEKTEHQRHGRENLLWWGKDGTAKFPRLKNFLTESDGLVPVDLWDYETSGTTDEGGQQIKELFGEAVFDNPKPTKLICRMLKLITSGQEEEFVLDFFAGSGSTAHAVYEANKLDGGKRRYILIQLPEKAQKGAYDSIADLSKERVRRVAAKLRKEDDQSLLEDEDQDLGFRVFRLTSSNFRRWQDQEEENIGGLILQAEQKVLTPLIDGAKQADVLMEIALLEGFVLSVKQTRAKEFKRNKITCITDSFNAHWLYVCLDREIWEETVDQVEQLPEDSVFYCFDNALSDEAKIQLAECCRVVTI